MARFAHLGNEVARCIFHAFENIYSRATLVSCTKSCARQARAYAPEMYNWLHARMYNWLHARMYDAAMVATVVLMAHAVRLRSKLHRIGLDDDEHFFRAITGC